MLAIAYSASIGGMATLVGSPPNLVFASVVKDLYQMEITFYNWIIFGLPVSAVLLLLCWKYLTTIAFRFTQKSFPGGKEEIAKQLKALGRISFEEKIVLVVFAMTALAWISRSYVLNRFIPELDDTMIAVVAAVLLLVLPHLERKKGRISHLAGSRQASLGHSAVFLAAVWLLRRGLKRAD